MASVLNSFAILGIDAYVVKIETDTIYGQPSVSIVGLGDAAIREAKERLEVAINHEKYEFPKMKIVINLAPCDIKKSGSHFDLGMALGLLVQSKQISFDDYENYGFIGELSLNGELRPCPGVLPMVIEARKKGISNIIVPSENFGEAKLVSGLNVFAFKTIKEVINFLEDKDTYQFPSDIIEHTVNIDTNVLDFKDVQGQDSIIDFIVAAAAGGHNIIMPVHQGVVNP